MRLLSYTVLLFAIGLSGRTPMAHSTPDEIILESEMRHLRRGSIPEWAGFSTLDADSALVIPFRATANTTAATLELAQIDVRYEWRVLLNDVLIGILQPDEQPMTMYYDIPIRHLKNGSNVLVVEQAGAELDDIMVGRISLHTRPRSALFNEHRVSLRVIDGHTHEPLPSRITIIDDHSSLQSVSLRSDSLTDEHRAVRPGTIYSGNGVYTFGLPEGSYTIFASRGFEYGADSVDVSAHRDGASEHTLTLRREVPTEGWIAMDTHVHTLTYSGHGDASAAERVLTLVGEGIELPVITEHNKNVDLRPLIESMGYESYVVPIVGNEFTTVAGHFNVFPVGANDPVPDPEVSTWAAVGSELDTIGPPEAVILNHARSTHAEFRPFGPRHFLAAVGRPRSGTTIPANAMEVINSSAQQGDIMRLVHDWFGTLNAGTFLTPVGSSDSHDVSRFLVGQGRTYVQVGNDSPQDVDIDHAVQRFRDGHVIASFGLMPTIRVDDEYGPGDLVPAARQVTVKAQVLAPSWLSASAASLHMNGLEIRDATITPVGRAGEKWSDTWTITLPPHDVFLSVVAIGSGDTPHFWPIPKPYQPESPLWTPHVIGITGAVWIDCDGDGRPTSARVYAERVVREAAGDLHRVVERLASFDEAVAAQAAAELYDRGQLSKDFNVESEMRDAPAHVRRGFHSFVTALRAF